MGAIAVGIVLTIGEATGWQGHGGEPVIAVAVERERQAGGQLAAQIVERVVGIRLGAPRIRCTRQSDNVYYTFCSLAYDYLSC